MVKKTSPYIKFLVLLLFSLSSCTSGCSSISLKSFIKEKIPTHAFVQVRKLTQLEGCGFDEETGKEICQTVEMKYVSSGSYVFHSKVEQGISYILTAGHSCQNSLPSSHNVKGIRIVNKGSRYIVVGFSGERHDAEVVSINKRFDLCLMSVSDVHLNPPVLELAKKEPERGEVVINMSAPHGLFWSGTVLIFRGSFSGFHDRGYSIYTIPTKPGSSGSPIINSSGRLVGVIFAGYKMIENVGLSSPLVAIKVFLKKSIIKGEMKLWEKLNKPEVNTQINRILTKNMKTKINEVFGK